jgi:hypothetical protein
MGGARERKLNAVTGRVWILIIRMKPGNIEQHYEVKKWRKMARQKRGK